MTMSKSIASCSSYGTIFRGDETLGYDRLHQFGLSLKIVDAYDGAVGIVGEKLLDLFQASFVI